MKNCKICKKEYNHQRYLNNKEKLLSQHKQWKNSHKNYDKIYRQLHKEKISNRMKKYYLKNRDKILNRCKNYRIKNKELLRKYYNNRNKIDINFKLKRYLRSRIWYALKTNSKSVKTMQLIGCSINQLKKHLEKQFQLGMSWSNYGKWHIDHKRPCCTFDLSKKIEQKKCFNYKNLRPLWAEENIKRTKKIYEK